MKILVTGGAGFLGINMIRHLLNRSHEVVSLDIADFEYYERNNPNLTIIKGSILKSKDLVKAMTDVDIVIHAASALPLYSSEKIFETIVGGTEMVLSHAKHMKIKRVVFISTTAVYGIPDHHPLYETDKLVGVGPYGTAKIRAERICQEYRDKGMIIPIIRPKSFIGPERLGVFALLYDWASTGHNFPIIGKGKNRYQLLDVEDLCEAIYRCIMNKNKLKVNDTFNVGAASFKTIKEDYQSLLDYAGYNKKIKCLPKHLTIFTLKILEFFKLSPLYKWVYETVSEDSFVSIEKIEQVLNFVPQYSNKQALIRNYIWYINNAHVFKKENGITHRVPWKQGILRIAKLFF